MRLLSSLVVITLLVVPALAQPGGQRGQRPGGGQRGQGQRGQRGQGRPGGGQLVDPISKALDADGDGSLSEKEIANAAERLKSLDTDGDGAIGPDELRNAMRAAFGGGGRGGPGGGGRGGGGGPGSPGSSTLERAGLKVGVALPDLTIHNAEGGEFRMADVKGKYTVIVFGCLT